MGSVSYGIFVRWVVVVAALAAPFCAGLTDSRDVGGDPCGALCLLECDRNICRRLGGLNLGGILGNLQSVINMQLDNNQLSGGIPDAFQQFIGLTNWFGLVSMVVLAVVEASMVVLAVEASSMVVLAVGASSMVVLSPAHLRKPSHSRIDAEGLSTTIESGSFSSVKTELDRAIDPNCQTQIVSSDGSRKSCEEKDSSIKSVTEKLEKFLSPHRPPKQDNSNESLNCSKGTSCVKIVNGVAVVQGRTHSLVQRFERRETISSTEDQATDNISPDMKCDRNEDQTTNITPPKRLNSSEDQAINVTPHMRPDKDRATTITPHSRFNSTAGGATDASSPVRSKKSEDQATTITLTRSRFKKNEDRATTINPHSRFTSTAGRATDTSTPVRFKKNEDRATTITLTRSTGSAGQATDTSPPVRYKRSRDRATTITRQMRFSSIADQATENTPPHTRFKKNEDLAITPQVICKADERLTVLKGEPQISGRDTTSANDAEVIENLMQDHDVFLSTLRSRLAKLHVMF